MGADAMDVDNGNQNINQNVHEQGTGSPGASEQALRAWIAKAEQVGIMFRYENTSTACREKIEQIMQAMAELSITQQLAQQQQSAGANSIGSQPAPRPGKADCPQPSKFTGTKEPFSEWKHSFIRFAVANPQMPRECWARWAAGFFEDRSPAQVFFNDYLESQDDTWEAVATMAWEEFCSIMEGSGLGKPMGDIEVREKCMKSRQRAPEPDTIQFVNHMEKLFIKAPTPLDDGTKIFMLLTNCTRKLHEMVVVPVAGGVWTSYADLKKCIIDKAHHHDTAFRGYTWEGMAVGDKRSSGSSGFGGSRIKFRTPEVSFAGVAGKDTGYVGGSSSRFGSAAAAAAGGAGPSGVGKQVRWADRGGSSNRFGPYSPRTSAQIKYGFKESFNPSLEPEEVRRNAAEARCHHCKGIFKGPNGMFDRKHLSSCPARKQKRDVSGDR